MVTITEAKVPAEEFALYETLQSVSEASFECEQIVETGDQTVMPLIWSYGVEAESLEQALEDDPSVNDTILLAEFDNELLYRMEWIDRVRLVLQMLTNSQASILNSYGNGETWTLRILYPDRESLSHTHEFCNVHGLEFEIHYIREMDSKASERFRLTTKQHEALTIACERGYFEVPREITLQELAAELNVSHQALSERLRRAHHALIQEYCCQNHDG